MTNYLEVVPHFHRTLRIFRITGLFWDQKYKNKFGKSRWIQPEFRWRSDNSFLHVANWIAVKTYGNKTNDFIDIAILSNPRHIPSRKKYQNEPNENQRKVKRKLTVWDQCQNGTKYKHKCYYVGSHQYEVSSSVCRKSGQNQTLLPHANQRPGISYEFCLKK